MKVNYTSSFNLIVKIPFVVSIISCLLFYSCKKIGSLEEIRKDYICNFGVCIEKVPSSNHVTNRYTNDNIIYTLNKKFIFDYYIIRKHDTFKIKTPIWVNVEEGIDNQKVWDYIPYTEKHQDKIEKISITILNGVSNDNQTRAMYNYHYSINPGFTPFHSTSGIIENSFNVWLHPHRDKYFMILELNPFPFIQKPFEVGNKWDWTLEVGDSWSDKRWQTWHGTIKNHIEYEIIGKKRLKTKIGEIECWVIESTAKSNIGTTGLVAYFSKRYGFVNLDYTNIDNSQLIISISEILIATE